MKTMRRVPFYANTKDNTRCFQAALKMVLNYFIPDKTFSWKRMDAITEKEKDMWTWPIKGVLALHRMGFDIVSIDIFDYEQFILDPKGYLRHEYGEEVAREQILHSDVSQAGIDAKEMIREVSIQRRTPVFADIRQLLDEKRLLVCLVNAQTLNRKKGYVGHFVVVWKCTEKMVYLHDPGLPPRKNRRVTRRVFEEAWADPNEKAKGIMAFRL